MSRPTNATSRPVTGRARTRGRIVAMHTTTDLRNPTVRRHPWWSVLASMVLVAASTGVAVWVSVMCDVLRVSVLDARLAYQVGYAGEIGGRTDLYEPRGLGFDQLMVLWFGALVLILIAYPVVVVARRSIGDPNAVAFATGTAVLGCVPGFVWLSLDWLEVPSADEGPVKTAVRHADLWLLALLVLVGASFLASWWSRPAATTHAPAGSDRSGER